MMKALVAIKTLAPTIVRQGRVVIMNAGIALSRQDDD